MTRRRLAALALPLALVACSSFTGYRVRSEGPADVAGRWMDLPEGGEAELLACDHEAFYLVQHGREPRYARVPWIYARPVVLPVAGSNQSAIITTWTVVGTVSTLSHGYFLILSVPVWLAVGIPLALLSERDEEPAAGCGDLRPYARFPEGLPESYRARFVPAQGYPSYPAPPLPFPHAPPPPFPPADAPPPGSPPAPVTQPPAGGGAPAPNPDAGPRGADAG